MMTAVIEIIVGCALAVLSLWFIRHYSVAIRHKLIACWLVIVELMLRQTSHVTKELQ